MRLRVAIDFLRRRLSDTGSRLTVLELGCGYEAANLCFLAQEFPDSAFSGVDLRLDPDLAASDVTPILGNLDDWEPSERWDCVFSLAVAEHLTDVRRHFRLIASCLAPGGAALITTPTPPAHFALAALSFLRIFDREECADHKLYLTREGIRVLARESGLAVQSQRYFQLGMNQWVVLTPAEGGR